MDHGYGSTDDMYLRLYRLHQDCIKIHLKGSRGPIHVLTCETNGSDTTTQSEQLRTGRFLTLEESRIETTPLLAGYTLIAIVLI